MLPREVGQTADTIPPPPVVTTTTGNSTTTSNGSGGTSSNDSLSGTVYRQIQQQGGTTETETPVTPILPPPSEDIDTQIKTQVTQYLTSEHYTSAGALIGNEVVPYGSFRVNMGTESNPVWFIPQSYNELQEALIYETKKNVQYIPVSPQLIHQLGSQEYNQDFLNPASPEQIQTETVKPSGGLITPPSVHEALQELGADITGFFGAPFGNLYSARDETLIEAEPGTILEPGVGQREINLLIGQAPGLVYAGYGFEELGTALKAVPLASKVFIGTTVVTGGVMLGYTAADIKSTSQYGQMTRYKVFSLGEQLALFSVGGAAKPTYERLIGVQPEAVNPKQGGALTQAYNKLTERILYGNPTGDYAGFVRGVTPEGTGGLYGFVEDYFPETLKLYRELKAPLVRSWEKSDIIYRRLTEDILEKPGKTITTGSANIAETILTREPYEESFLKETLQPLRKPVTIMYTDKEGNLITEELPGWKQKEIDWMVKNYAGQTPKDILQRTSVLQLKVREGATWIQEKALFEENQGAMKYFSIEGYREKPGMQGLGFKRTAPSVSTEDVLPELTPEETPTPMSKGFKEQYYTENKWWLHEGEEEPIDKLIAKTGKTVTQEKMFSTKSVAGKASGFENMDELGGFKKMYTRKTGVLVEEEPQTSDYWKDTFINRPRLQRTQRVLYEPTVAPAIAIPLTKPVTISLSRQNILTGLTTIQDVMKKQRTDFLSKTAQLQRTDVISGTIIKTTPIEIQSQKQQQDLIHIQLQKQITLQRTRTPLIETPKTPTIKTSVTPILISKEEGKGEEKRRRKKKEAVAFIPVVHEKGRWIPVTRQPLSYREAEAVLAKALDETKAAVGKLKPVSGTPEPYQGGPLKPFESLAYKFKQKGNLLIEKREYRMDMPGEIKQISAKGWRANVQKGMITRTNRNIDYVGKQKPTIIRTNTRRKRYV